MFISKMLHSSLDWSQKEDIVDEEKDTHFSFISHCPHPRGGCFTQVPSYLKSPNLSPNRF